MPELVLAEVRVGFLLFSNVSVLPNLKEKQNKFGRTWVSSKILNLELFVCSRSNSKLGHSNFTNFIQFEIADSQFWPKVKCLPF